MLLGICFGVISFFYNIVAGQTEWGTKTKVVLEPLWQDISYCIRTGNFDDLSRVIMSETFIMSISGGLLGIIYSFLLGFIPGLIISWLFF